MSMTRLKRRVTKYFRWRKKTLATLGGSKIANDDFFELYVLARVVRQLKPAPTIRRANDGKYVIAASPSPNWQDASYFEVIDSAGQRRGLRSGLEVQGLSGKGTAELDVSVVRLPGHDEGQDPIQIA